MVALENSQLEQLQDANAPGHQPQTLLGTCFSLKNKVLKTPRGDLPAGWPGQVASQLRLHLDAVLLH